MISRFSSIAARVACARSDKPFETLRRMEEAEGGGGVREGEGPRLKADGSNAAMGAWLPWFRDVEAAA